MTHELTVETFSVRPRFLRDWIPEWAFVAGLLVAEIAFVVAIALGVKRTWRFRLWLLGLTTIVIGAELVALSMVGFTEHVIF